MQLGINAKRDNELLITLDWLSFTDLTHSNPMYVCKMLGYSLTDFAEQPKGSNGYNKMLRNQAGVRILYDGRDGMGVHVDAPGSAVFDLFEHYQKSRSSVGPFGNAYETDSLDGAVLSDLFRDVCRIGKATRIDIAIDDKGNQYYSVAEIEELIEKTAIVSKFRKYNRELEGSFSSDTTGRTVYLGKRKSDVYIRVYDKQYEQNEKLESQGTELIQLPWTRWELEFKHDHTVRIAEFFAKDEKIQEIALGVLSNYVRIIEPDTATRKTRCRVSEKWLSFLDGVKKVKLYISSAPKAIEETLAWAKKQWPKAVAKLSYLWRMVFHGFLNSGIWAFHA